MKKEKNYSVNPDTLPHSPKREETIIPLYEDIQLKETENFELSRNAAYGKISTS